MEQPELWTYQWVDIGGHATIGEPTIMCTCGAEVNEDHWNMDDKHNDYWVCPKCGKKIVWKFKVWVEFAKDDSN